MTMREEFEAWLNGEIEETVGAYEAWCGAYRAGQVKMRERAAQLLELEYAPDKKASDRLKQIAGHIRALKAD